MPEATLADLLYRNARHASRLPPDYFEDVSDSQRPAVVSMCCADSRVTQEGMWDVTEPGWLFTPSTIGNQVWDERDGDLVVDGSVLYPMLFTETKLTAVVGHTGCGAVTAALEAVRNGSGDSPQGVAKWIDLLLPVVEAGLDEIRADHPAGEVNQLVEYNVDRQVAFLTESEDVPNEEAVYGFVYDLHGVYGDQPGRTYLVNAQGQTDLGALREQVPEDLYGHVKRLLGRPDHQEGL